MGAYLNTNYIIIKDCNCALYIHKKGELDGVPPSYVGNTNDY